MGGKGGKSGCGAKGSGVVAGGGEDGMKSVKIW